MYAVVCGTWDDYYITSVHFFHWTAVRAAKRLIVSVDYERLQKEWYAQGTLNHPELSRGGYVTVLPVHLKF